MIALRRAFSRPAPVLLLTLLLTLCWAARPAAAAPPVQQATSTVYVLTFEGAVTPVLESYLTRAIATGQAMGAEAVILQLDTPGGSVEVTKSIVQQMLASPLPTVVFVAPPGAHAGSAGTFITLAAHIAAMAPGTSIGAAGPVDIDGSDVDETMAAKIKNILSADMENLSARRGDKATEWAIAAVQDAAAATADQALELGVIDLIAADLPDLLQQMDGRSVMVGGESRVLRTANAVSLPVPMTAMQRLLNLLANPTIATLLMSLGMLGLFIEIRTPGFGVPGILGMVSTLMALYGLGLLNANWAGLALIAVALALFVAEAFTPTFGVLSLGGVVAFILGGALLFDTPGLQVPWVTLIILAVALGGFTLFAGVKALAAQRRPAYSGGEGLIGRIATAKAPFHAGETGSVFVHGEWWNAQLTAGALDSGEQARVVGRDGLTLIVSRIA